MPKRKTVNVRTKRKTSNTKRKTSNTKRKTSNTKRKTSNNKEIKQKLKLFLIDKMIKLKKKDPVAYQKMLCIIKCKKTSGKDLKKYFKCATPCADIK
jgi:hypothetical protein